MVGFGQADLAPPSLDLTRSGVRQPQPLDEVARGGGSHSGGVKLASLRRDNPGG
jgi:hypothetical protein